MDNRMFARVDPSVTDGKVSISWLEINPSEDGFASVFMFEDISTTCEYDSWFPTIEDALEWAEEQFGVKHDAWLSADELRQMGITEISDDR